MSNVSQSLFEKWRPRRFEDVVAQDGAIDELRTFGRNGFGGQSYLFIGGSGTGKSTLAGILASEIADSHWIEHIEAGDLTVDRLREIENDWHYYGGGKGGRAYVIEECHGMRAQCVRKLKVMLEAIPSHVLIAFTTTVEGEGVLIEGAEDPKPLFDRMNEIRLARRDLCKPFARLLKSIAESEGLDGRPIEDYERVMKKCGNSMRAGIQYIASGKMKAGAA